MERLKNNVPEEIKKRVEAITKRYIINGICDPMYIANIIANRTGCGDGMGEFTSVPEFTTEQCETVATALRNAYGCNIFDEDLEELTGILKTGKLSAVRSIEGLYRFINKLYAQNETCNDEFRKEYNEKQMRKANDVIYDLIGGRSFPTTEVSSRPVE